MSASKYSTELKEFNNGSKFAEYLENLQEVIPKVLMTGMNLK